MNKFKNQITSVFVFLFLIVSFANATQQVNSASDEISVGEIIDHTVFDFGGKGGKNQGDN